MKRYKDHEVFEVMLSNQNGDWVLAMDAEAEIEKARWEGYNRGVHDGYNCEYDKRHGKPPQPGGPDVKRGDPKKKKANPRKASKKYADTWCRAYAKKRYPVCVTCGKGPNEAVMDWAHLLTAAAESTRWDIFNFAVQCRGCNMRHEYDPSRFTVWFINHYSADAYEALALRHHTPAHFKTANLIAIGERYKRLYEEMV